VNPPEQKASVGYRNPPRNTRWKRGQSGNPKGRKPRRKAALELVDELLTAPIKITFGGEEKIVPRLEAILMQLAQKQMAGSARAARVLMKYEEFASANMTKKLSITFVESEYTRAFANLPGGGNDV
jgi:hypothetical protein